MLHLRHSFDSDKQTDLVLKFSPTSSNCLTLGRYLINLSMSLSLLFLKKIIYLAALGLKGITDIVSPTRD